MLSLLHKHTIKNKLNHTKKTNANIREKKKKIKKLHAHNFKKIQTKIKNKKKE